MPQNVSKLSERQDRFFCKPTTYDLASSYLPQLNHHQIKAKNRDSLQCLCNAPDLVR